MTGFIHFNGEFLEESEKIISPSDRGFRYGEGVFETIRVSEKAILLEGYHMERLFGSLGVLHFDLPPYFTPAWLSEQILALCAKNNHLPRARVRVTVFRGAGNLQGPTPHAPPAACVIQSETLAQSRPWLQEKGLVVGTFPDGRKSCDKFSHLKSNNYLLYIMAAYYGSRQGWQDTLILNCRENVCETSICNIFTVKDRIIYTPPLSEGCIAGVMRRYLAEQLPQKGFLLKESPLSVENIKQADEVFCSNAILGLRWVSRLDDVQYGNNLVKSVFDEVIKNLG